MSAVIPVKKPRARASHPKSRKGCFKCKARKIKCDEVKPRCGACRFRDTECIFPSFAIVESPSQGKSHGYEALSDHASTAAYTRTVLNRQGSSERVPILVYAETMQRRSKARADSDDLSTPEDSDEVGQGTLNSLMQAAQRRSHQARQKSAEQPHLGKRISEQHLSDLGLMSHWCTNTATLLEHDKTKARIWTHHVPALATTNACVMHAILAMSALHLALSGKSMSNLVHQAKGQYSHISTSRRAEMLESSEELRLALAHQSSAVENLAKELQNLSASNTHAVATTTILLSFLAFGVQGGRSQRSQQDQASKGPALNLEWYTLLHHFKRFGSLLEIFMEGPLAEGLQSDNTGWISDSLLSSKKWPGTLMAAQILENALQALEITSNEILSLQRPSKNWIPFINGMTTSFRTLQRILTTYDASEPANSNCIETYESNICAVEILLRQYTSILTYHISKSPDATAASTVFTSPPIKTWSTSKPLFQLPKLLPAAVTESAYMAWATETTPAFTKALQEGRPRTLLVLAHFYVLACLDEHGHGIGWKRDCGRAEILKIRDLLGGESHGGRWVDALRWPVDVALVTPGLE